MQAQMVSSKDDLRDVRKAFRTILQIQGGGFDVTAHYSQDLPEGEYAIKQPTAGNLRPLLCKRKACCQK
ncbi:hypothetical protein WJX77_006351 [Trebouxia sp. C0004]